MSDGVRQGAGTRDSGTCFLALFCCVVHCGKGVFSQKLSRVHACVSNVCVCVLCVL